ncbi:MAG: class I SAM-dependent methyltransferase [Solirubrobacteraceae bacterium]
MDSLKLRAADAADTARGRRDELTPPRRLNFVGDSDFRATGDELARHFRELAGLQSSDRVLDIGCGIGRMARVLVPVLRPPGSYDGFDIVRPGISWCQKHYRDTPAPFRFHHADLHNAQYNPSGVDSALGYRFPYDDHSFDLALTTSVFTHLLAHAVDHYLAEAARVLAPGGRLFATWFLLTDENLVTPPPPFRFSDATAPAAIADPAAPEAAVAFDEAWVRERLRAHGFQLREPIHRGSWAGRSGRSLQDITVASRRR